MKSLKRVTLLASMLAIVPAFSTGSAYGKMPEPEKRAVWIWGSTVRNLGAETIAATLQQKGITDAILLVKGTAGTVAYPSAIAPPAASVDTLGQFIAACHPRGIKVHAWLNYHQDDAFGTKTARKYTIYHVARNPAQPYSVNDGRICPLRAKEEYNAYFLSIVQEILLNYQVDGIHLDYIRYPHTVYCFCPAHRQFAAEHGINFERVRDLINQTYYVPGDQQTYFNAFAAGDPDAVKWAGMRVDEVNSVVAMVRQAVGSHNATYGRNVALSAALMPEGGLTSMATSGARSDQFGLCHYAQKYEDIASATSFIAPMSYHADYGKPASWVGDVTAGAVAKAAGKPVLAGIQAYSPGTAQQMKDALSAARWNGASGFVLFRYGTMTAARWTAIVPTLDTLMATVQDSFDAGWIDNPGVYNSLQVKLKQVWASQENSDFDAARNQLHAFVLELNAQRGKQIDERAAAVISGEARWLLDLMQ